MPGAALYSYYTTGELKAEGSSITEGIGQGRVTANLEGFEPSQSFFIPDAESLEVTFAMLKDEGLALGLSSGVNVAGAIRLARELGPGQDHRHHAVRSRDPLSVAAVQPRIPALERLEPAGLARKADRGRAGFRPGARGSIAAPSPTQRRPIPMTLSIGSVAPDFTAETTQGTINFHDWIGDSYAILFSHPKDYTPVCTTELGYMAGLDDEFAKRNTKIIGLSVDKVGDHEGWAQDIKDVTGNEVNFPMIGDHDLKVAKLYNMLPADAGETSEGRTAANNATVRTVYIVGPDKLIKAMLIYPMSSGRNFDEVLRLLDSIQLTAKHSVATPVNWKQGEDCIIVPSLNDEAAREKFPGGWKTVKPYLRTVPQPVDEPQPVD